MARRNWDSLSSGYRKRLESSGITRRDYQSGQSLKAARGHSKTPERPGQGIRNPQYREYYVERADDHRETLEKRLDDRTKDVFGIHHKYRGRVFSIENPPEGAPEVTDEDIMEILYMSQDELEYFVAHDPRAWVLYYHGKK